MIDMKKLRAIVIIFLFLSVTIAPSINFTVVKASTDDELVEVTTQACGIQGYGDTSVKLTRQQYRDLQQYLGEFRARLNQTTTKEEAVFLFNEAVLELDKYRLLPKGMSVEQAHRLVIVGYQNILAMSRYKTRLSDYQLSNNSNFFCLITGETNVTRLHGYFETGCSALSYFLLVLYMFTKEPVVLLNIIFRLETIRNLYHKINSIRIIGTGNIAFGTCSDTGGHIPPFYHYEPAVGWITTQGLLGKKSWNGSFYGRLLPLATFDSYETIYYTGAIGFLGIKLKQGHEKLFFLGSAFHVKIS
jgi:hypothetical protein